MVRSGVLIRAAAGSRPRACRCALLTPRISLAGPKLVICACPRVPGPVVQPCMSWSSGVLGGWVYRVGTTGWVYWVGTTSPLPPQYPYIGIARAQPLPEPRILTSAGTPGPLQDPSAHLLLGPASGRDSGSHILKLVNNPECHRNSVMRPVILPISKKGPNVMTLNFQDFHKR